MLTVFLAACGPDAPFPGGDESGTGEGEGSSGSSGPGASSSPQDGSTGSTGEDSSSSTGSDAGSSEGGSTGDEGSTGVEVCTWDPALGCACRGLIEELTETLGGCWCGDPADGVEVPGEFCWPPACEFIPGAGCMCGGAITDWRMCFDTECALVGDECLCEGVPSPAAMCAA